jgi:hypothetical protein
MDQPVDWASHISLSLCPPIFQGDSRPVLEKPTCERPTAMIVRKGSGMPQSPAERKLIWRRIHQCRLEALINYLDDSS